AGCTSYGLASLALKGLPRLPCLRPPGYPTAHLLRARGGVMSDPAQPADATRILDVIQQGDRRAAADLLPLVFQELRELARRRLAREAPGQTLQATALVH